ncbi:MAG: Na/Pi symporter [Bacteroidota bacterium]
MLSRRIIFLLVVILLAVAFWVNPHFKEVSAGVAILLFGMIALEKGFKSLTEGPFKRLLQNATNRFYKSFTVGMVATAILQSSSMISVITISFLSTGLLALSQGIGIIFGANLGTTATAWLIASLGLKINISAMALPMIVFGVLFLFQKSNTFKAVGNVLAGMGFLFLGIHFMKEGFELYKEGIDLSQYAIEGWVGILIFVGIGVLITVILQSSSATMALILTALAAGQVSYFNALALAIGANVGTTITAILGALGTNAPGKRLATAHLIFNFMTAFLAVVLINQFVWIVQWISGIFNVSETDFTTQFAIFHTLFNLLGVIVLSPFVKIMVRFLEKYIVQKETRVEEPKFISELALISTQSARSALINESKNLFENASDILVEGLGLERKAILVDELSEKELELKRQSDISENYFYRVKNIYGKIIEFASKAQELSDDKEFIKEIYKIKQGNRYFVDAIKDVRQLQKNIYKFSTTDNEFINKEYNLLRVKISSLIREIMKIQSLETPSDKHPDITVEMTPEQVDASRAKLTKFLFKKSKDDLLFNGKVDVLIREKIISPQMASSLLNDSALTKSITKHLVKATELLYLDTDFLRDSNATVKTEDEDEEVLVENDAQDL